MAGWWERQQQRRQDKLNPLQGSAPMQPQMGQASAGLDARAGLESRRYAGDYGGLGDALAGFNALAAGQGPSLAQEQLKQAQQRNIAATIAAMGSSRSGNLAANQMAAGAAGMAGGQQAGMDAALLRSQEQLGAMQGAAGIAGQLAGLSSQRELAMLGMGQDALMGQAGLAQQWELERARMANEARANRNQAILGGLQLGAQVGGDVLGGVLSDERMKTEVVELEPGSLGERLAAFADDGSAAKEAGSWRTTEFAYTEEGKARGGLAGRLVGVMAQDLEQGERGREAVSERAGVKRIDGARGLSLALAGLADHERRMAAIEKGGA